MINVTFVQNLFMIVRLAVGIGLSGIHIWLMEDVKWDYVYAHLILVIVVDRHSCHSSRVLTFRQYL